jgi:hypothetical protein
VSLGYAKRRHRPRIRHQVPHLTRAPHCVQTHLASVAIDSTQTPQRVVEAVGVEDRDDRQRLVVGSRFAQVAQ